MSSVIQQLARKASQAHFLAESFSQFRQCRSMITEGKRKVTTPAQEGADMSDEWKNADTTKLMLLERYAPDTIGCPLADRSRSSQSSLYALLWRDSIFHSALMCSSWSSLIASSSVFFSPLEIFSSSSIGFFPDTTENDAWHYKWSFSKAKKSFSFHQLSWSILLTWLLTVQTRLNRHVGNPSLTAFDSFSLCHCPEISLFHNHWSSIFSFCTDPSYWPALPEAGCLFPDLRPFDYIARLWQAWGGRAEINKEIGVQSLDAAEKKAFSLLKDGPACSDECYQGHTHVWCAL